MKTTFQSPIQKINSKTPYGNRQINQIVKAQIKPMRCTQGTSSQFLYLFNQLKPKLKLYHALPCFDTVHCRAIHNNSSARFAWRFPWLPFYRYGPIPMASLSTASRYDFPPPNLLLLLAFS